LLTEQAPPRHTANTYVQLTRDRRPLVDGTEQASYESALADRMIESPGGLMPADVMRMALDVTGGDYPLYAADPVGPWYHQFGVFFIGSVTSGDEASLSAWVENGTRWLGLGSNRDTFKEATNACAGRLATAISALSPLP
jgi:hypothetical protein